MAYHNELGKQGEALAVAHLESIGYEILERNFRYDRAEIDIIARRKQGEIVVVEVKTRNSSAFGDPQQFVYKSKIRQLVKAADGYLNLNGLEDEVRFDIIAVLKNSNVEEVTHFEDAFYHF
jgi:putative endonuclease